MPIVNTRFRTSELLVSKGPVIPVSITLSDESQRAYSNQGKEIPQVVSGLALVDTGASKTCFDEASAIKAGLPVIDTAIMSSASHTNHRVKVFMGKIVLDQSNIVINVENGLGANLTAFDGIVALIGRNLLRSAMFTYNGPDGLISIAM